GPSWSTSSTTAATVWRWSGSIPTPSTPPTPSSTVATPPARLWPPLAPRSRCSVSSRPRRRSHDGTCERSRHRRKSTPCFRRWPSPSPPPTRPPPAGVHARMCTLSCPRKPGPSHRGGRRQAPHAGVLYSRRIRPLPHRRPRILAVVPPHVSLHHLVVGRTLGDLEGEPARNAGRSSSPSSVSEWRRPASLAKRI